MLKCGWHVSERGSERSQWGACVARWPGTPGPPWCGRWWWSRTDWSCTGPACCWCLYNWLHCSRTIDHPTGGQETIPSQGGIDTTTHNYQQQILLTAVERFVTDFSQDWSEISFVGLDQIQKMNWCPGHWYSTPEYCEGACSLTNYSQLLTMIITASILNKPRTRTKEVFKHDISKGWDPHSPNWLME